MTIRSLVADDLPAVASLEDRTFTEPWSEAMLREELAGPGRTYLVAIEDAEIVGYGGIMVVETDAHIMTLAVSDRRRRTGVGSLLLLTLIERALDAGAEHLTLELRLSNEPARALYEKFGFAVVGVRPRYYPDEDALVMWALDVGGPEYRAMLDRIRAEAA